MINFDALTLKLFSDEASDFLIGARLQKIQQPSRTELIFYLRNNSLSKKLYINFNPNCYHICFMSKENELKRNIIIPKTAPMFCMLLRKYILNSKIVNIEVPKYERIFEIYFEYYDELNEKLKLCLAVELMGKYSNVILYNYDTNVIIGCAHNVGSDKSRERELYGSLPYIYPSKQKKINLLKSSFDNFKKNIDYNNLPKSISSKYHYLTASTVDKIKSLSESDEELYIKLKDFLARDKFIPYISKDYSEYFLFEFENSIKQKDINTAIDNYYSFRQAEFIKENLKSKILKYAKTQLLKLESLKNKQINQMEKIDKALLYKEKADVLMAGLYYIKQGMKEIKLNNFEGKEIIIELNENLTPVENANKYYELYKKTKTAYEHASELIKDTNSQILYFEELIFFTQNSSDINELNEIYNEINNKPENKQEKNIKTDFIEFEGFKIYIGKNKKQNDYILSKLSNSEDLWFHPLNSAGAHILVKTNNSTTVPDNVILKAAQLTKDYSSQKNNSKTSIIYTKRKFVKKAKNKLAFVTYKNETEVIV